MKKITILSTFAILLVSSCNHYRGISEVKEKKPNVILILADDLGFSDIGAYGSEITTPNLDVLASEGVSFREFYNVGICAPTRASLLTGLYQHDAGVGYFAVNLGTKHYQGYLTENTLTIAEALKSQGYATYMSGKWHVGSDSVYWPNQRGFDQFYGFEGGASSFFNYQPYSKRPTTLIKNNVKFNAEGDDFYLTNAITDEAIQMIKGGEGDDKPFFLYLAYNAPHWPLHALPEDIERFEGVFDEGWDNIHEQRYKNLISRGIVSADHPKAERPSTIPAWETLEADERKEWSRRMQVHAAMIYRMDQNIGKLITYLKETGQYENTAIFFLSDNGAAGEDMSGRRSQFLASFNNGSATEELEEGPIGSRDSYYSITHRWAYAANTPFSFWKTFPYEGGISTPFIARYPGKFKTDHIATGRGHLIDIYPTILEITGSSYLTEYNGNEILPLAGKSLVPYLSGEAEAKTDTLYFERAGNRAVRTEKWKLLSLRGNDEWKLFDLENDRGETQNLSAEHPTIVRELDKAYKEWAINHHVLNTDSLLRAVRSGRGMSQFEERLAGTIPEKAK